MTPRREARERAAQFLFQLDMNAADSVDDALATFWELQENLPARQTISFAEQLIHGVLDKRSEIDRAIVAHADNWDLSRMGAVDRNVLRVATFEMLYCDDIPPVVSVNEAVDVVKDLSNAESGRFVNGILDQILRKLGRPARTAAKARRPAREE
jgi:transcription antitermination protein NusB